MGSPRKQAKALAKHGRNGDTELAHLSADEIAILDSLQGGSSINPVTGLPEYFSLGKVIKNVAKAAGALVGGYLGGPAGAALGGGATSLLLGDSAKKALTTGLLSGLGAYGVQQTGLGDSVGGGFNSQADLLGRAGGDAAGAALSGGSKSSSGGITSLLPILGLGAAGAAAAGYDAPKQPKVEQPEEYDWQEYGPLERAMQGSPTDYYSYGQFGPEFQYFDEVNPQPQPMRKGGRVHMLYGGKATEGNAARGGDFGQRDTRGGGSQSGGSGERGTLSQVQDRMNMQTARDWGNTAPGVGNYADAQADFNNLGQGWREDPLGALGRVVGGIFGAGEINPASLPKGTFKNRNTATWGVDPIGAAMGLGGLAGVLPFGAGALYQGAKGLSGWQGPMIALEGPNPDWGFTGTSHSLNGGLGGMLGGEGAEVGVGGGRQGSNDLEPSGIQSSLFNPTKTAAAAAVKKPAAAAAAAAPDQDEEATGRTYNPLANPYSYGQFGPEHSFFSGALPTVDLNMRSGGGVSGPGTGQSDDIPAMLSDGEHVIDAETVSMIGDGSNNAGHQRIEGMKRKIRSKKRKAKPSKIPPKTGGLSQYMRSAA